MRTETLYQIWEKTKLTFEKEALSSFCVETPFFIASFLSGKRRGVLVSNLCLYRSQEY
jgi:hypothetical protein